MEELRKISENVIAIANKLVRAKELIEVENSKEYLEQVSKKTKNAIKDKLNCLSRRELEQVKKYVNEEKKDLIKHIGPSSYGKSVSSVSSQSWAKYNIACDFVAKVCEEVITIKSQADLTNTVNRQSTLNEFLK